MAIVKGISWPFRRGRLGFPATNEGINAVRDKLFSLVTTGPGERIYRPELGIDAHGYVFENITPIQRSRIAQQVRRAILSGIPSVDLISVRVDEHPDKSRPGFLIVIVYSYRGEDDDLAVPLGG